MKHRVRNEFIAQICIGLISEDYRLSSDLYERIALGQHRKGSTSFRSNVILDHRFVKVA